MSEGAEPIPRGLLARIGVSALNILGNGLGLIRVGQVRRGLVFMTAQLAVGGVVVAAYFLVDRFTPRAWLTLFAIGFLMVVALLLTSIWQTWRGSRFIRTYRPKWSRWYAVVGIGVTGFLANNLLAELGRGQFSTHYLVSAGSAPNILIGDRILLSQQQPAQLRRGMVMGMEKDDAIFIFRLIGLPGDTVEMRAGHLVLNGVAVRTETTGQVMAATDDSGQRWPILTEYLPGNATGHLIGDSGFSPVSDNFGPVRVPAGHVFLLGDNRDNSADSRFADNPMAFGLGMVPLEQLLGEVQFITFNPGDLDRIGLAIR